MDFKMSNSDQKIINFDYEKNFNDEDYYISNANKHTYDLLNNWPNWELIPTISK